MAAPQPPQPHSSTTSPADSEKREKCGSPWPRVVFWALLLYSLGLAAMVMEDFLSHTFNR